MGLGDGVYVPVNKYFVKPHHAPILITDPVVEKKIEGFK